MVVSGRVDALAEGASYSAAIPVFKSDLQFCQQSLEGSKGSQMNLTPPK